MTRTANEDDESDIVGSQTGPRRSPNSNSPRVIKGHLQDGPRVEVNFNSLIQTDHLHFSQSEQNGDQIPQSKSASHVRPTPNHIPPKPRTEKQKTRMEDGDGTKTDQTKRETIKKLKFSPRVTRSQTRWKETQKSESSHGSCREEGDSASCSVNITELNYAFTLGNKIGFENRGGRDHLGDVESKRGETTGKS